MGWGGGCSLGSVYTRAIPKGLRDAMEGSFLWQVMAGSGPHDARVLCFPHALINYLAPGCVIYSFMHFTAVKTCF